MAIVVNKCLQQAKPKIPGGCRFLYKVGSQRIRKGSINRLRQIDNDFWNASTNTRCAAFPA